MKKAILIITITACLISKTYSQTYFEIEKQYSNSNCGTNSKKISTLTKLSDADISKAFSAIIASGMEFGYPQGGCQQRAEMMHSILHDINIDHAKIWLFAPANIQIGSNIALEIADQNKLVADNIIKWNYHVAPIVLSSKGDTLVLDPALNKNAPLKIREWFKAMKNSNVSSYTVLDPNYYFFFTDNNSKITGCFYKYEPMAGYSTMYDKCVVERELAINDLAIFLKKKLDNGYQDPSNQIRALVSDVNNMINFFTASDREKSYLQGISVRNLLTNHSALINEAMKYYSDRLTFWINAKNKLK
jgi:hypothetical protein